MRRIVLTLTIVILTLYCAYSNTTSIIHEFEPFTLQKGLSSFALQVADSLKNETDKPATSTKPKDSKRNPAQERERLYSAFESFVEESPKLNAKFEPIKKDIQDLKVDMDSINVRLEKQKSEMDEMTGFKEGYNKNKLLVLIALIALAILLIVIVLYFVLRFKGLRDEIVDVVTGSDRIKKWFKNNNEKPSIIPVQKSNDGEIRSLQNENRDLKKRVTQLEDYIREWGKKSESIVLDQTPEPPKPAESQKKLFADSILNEVFLRVRQQENDDTLYVLKLKSETHATFTLYERAYNRVIANTSFLEGCEKQVLGNSSVEIIREGEAEKGADGKWKVVTPLKIEIR